MSAVLIRTALETALNSMSPALSTAWENAEFTPVVGTAYQKAHVLFAQPDNLEAGSSHMERGFMQIDLLYPENTGAAGAEGRAELIRSTFYRGATFTSGAVDVVITETPEIARGEPEDGRYVVRVMVPFKSFIP